MTGQIFNGFSSNQCRDTIDKWDKGDIGCTQHFDKCVFVQIAITATITGPRLLLMDSFTVISIKNHSDSLNCL